jgi:hypothetical protein
MRKAKAKILNPVAEREYQSGPMDLDSQLVVMSSYTLFKGKGCLGELIRNY